MKKFILTIFTGLALIAVSCKPDDTKTDVTAVAFGDDSIVLSVGLTQPLSFVVSPLGANDEALTWSSSSDAVATVDQDGWITAIAPGTATITAKSANGKTATCEVTVIISRWAFS